MTGKQLLEKLTQVGVIEHAFRFPYAYIRSITADFEGLDDEEREMLACEKMKLTIADVRKTAADCFFTLQWMTAGEASHQKLENRGEHWLRAFIDDEVQYEATPVIPIRVAHFFGYKGGQGRSTVLASLAQKLAHEGVRVLVLDADIEAPSLDVMFGVKANLNASLLGIVHKSPNIIAVPALQGRDGGEVRLIACRPRDPRYDIDFSAFALQTSLVPGILLEAIERIRDWAIAQKFDVILVDHRSGMAMTTLTWMKYLPGPVAVFAKLDGQWQGAEEVFRKVFAANTSNPGLVVSFKPDDETEDGFRRRTVQQRNELLRLVGEAVAKSIQSGSDESYEDYLDDPASIEDHWILWPYDQAFRSTTLPDYSSIGSGTKSVLSELTRLLEIQLPVKKSKLSGIGSIDQGDLIQTEALMRLRQPNNTFRYIFGRKGTGKTRLAKQLDLENLGEALLVDANSEMHKGITTAEAEFSQAKEMFKSTPEALWWVVLLAALQGADTQRSALRDRLATILSNKIDIAMLRQQVFEVLPKEGSRVFLVDGIETAFGASDVYSYVESLFLFMLAIQSDDRFTGKVEVKLFLRTDLASQRVQNLEQQVDGRKMDLYWDYRKILNFLLSRLPQLQFFKATFPDIISQIESEIDTIRLGEVTEQECEQLVMQFFPSKLPHFNILTSTFLRLHFADSSSQGASYYPRVVDSFLSELNSIGEKIGISSLVDDRIDQQYLIKAHEQASDDYMNQIRQELQYLLDFKQKTPEANLAKQDDWINAFTGQSTPFKIDEIEEYLTKQTKLDKLTVRRCLDQMLALGIFERSTDTPNVWRTGRLFKSSLKMKYKRIK